jgi:hypothetical protein
MTELTPAGQIHRPVYCRVAQVNPGPNSSCYEKFTGKNAVLWMMPIRIQIRLSVLMPIRIRIRDLLQVLHKLDIRIYFFTFLFMVLSFSSVSYPRCHSFQHIEIFWKKYSLPFHLLLADTEMDLDPASGWQALDADPELGSIRIRTRIYNTVLPVIFAFLFYKLQKHGKYSWTTVG